MELTARGCRATRTVHEPVPIQSLGSLVLERPKPYLNRLAQSRWGSVPASSSGLTDPVLRANLFLKLWIRLADFPTLFYWPEAVHLGDLLQLWVRPEAKSLHSSPGFSRAGQCNTGRCSRRSSLRGATVPSPIQSVSGKPAPYNDGGLRPASLSSIASQFWPSRGGELRLQVREYWPDSLSTRGCTPARGRPAPPLRAELP